MNISTLSIIPIDIVTIGNVIKIPVTINIYIINVNVVIG